MNLETLILEFGADFAALDDALNKSSQKARQTAADIEKTFKGLNANIIPKVDHRPLNALNDHLNVKEKHIDKLNKKVIKVRFEVDSSALLNLNQRIKSFQKITVVTQNTAQKTNNNNNNNVFGILALLQAVKRIENKLYKKNPSSSDVTLQASDVTLNSPSVTLTGQVSIPNSNVTLSTPNVTLSTPNVTLSTPNVTLSTPNVTLSTPNVTLSTPNVTLSTPNFTLTNPGVTFTSPINVPNPQNPNTDPIVAKYAEQYEADKADIKLRKKAAKAINQEYENLARERNRFKEEFYKKNPQGKPNDQEYIKNINQRIVNLMTNLMKVTKEGKIYDDPSELPSQYLEILKIVMGGKLPPGHKIPQIVDSTNTLRGKAKPKTTVHGFYDFDANAINLPSKIIEALKQGTLKGIELETLIHELIHYIQFGGANIPGKIKTIKNRIKEKKKDKSAFQDISGLLPENEIDDDIKENAKNVYSEERQAFEMDASQRARNIAKAIKDGTINTQEKTAKNNKNSPNISNELNKILDVLRKIEACVSQNLKVEVQNPINIQEPVLIKIGTETPKPSTGTETPKPSTGTGTPKPSTGTKAKKTKPEVPYINRDRLKQDLEKAGDDPKEQIAAYATDIERRERLYIDTIEKKEQYSAEELLQMITIIQALIDQEKIMSAEIKKINDGKSQYSEEDKTNLKETIKRYRTKKTNIIKKIGELADIEEFTKQGGPADFVNRRIEAEKEGKDRQVPIPKLPNLFNAARGEQQKVEIKRQIQERGEESDRQANILNSDFDSISEDKSITSKQKKIGKNKKITKLTKQISEFSNEINQAIEEAAKTVILAGKTVVDFFDNIKQKANNFSNNINQNDKNDDDNDISSEFYSISGTTGDLPPIVNLGGETLAELAKYKENIIFTIDEVKQAFLQLFNTVDASINNINATLQTIVTPINNISTHIESLNNHLISLENNFNTIGNNGVQSLQAINNDTQALVAGLNNVGSSTQQLGQNADDTSGKFQELKQAWKDFLDRPENEALRNVVEGLSGLFELVNGFEGLFYSLSVLSPVFNTITAGIQASFEAALNMERLEFSLNVSTENAEQSLATLKEQADQLGTSFLSSAKNYQQFSASVLNTPLEFQKDKIFKQINMGLATRGASAEQQDRALLALTQMASKGRISLEELNQQLGEALPGALQIASRAMGLTSQELIKLIESGAVLGEDLIPKLGNQIELESAGGLNAIDDSAFVQVARFQNEIESLKIALGEPLLDATKLGLPIVIKTLNALIDNGKTVMTVLVSLGIISTLALLGLLKKLGAIDLALKLIGVSAKTTKAAIGQLALVLGKGLLLTAAISVAIAAFQELWAVINAGSEESKKNLKSVKESLEKINSVPSKPEKLGFEIDGGKSRRAKEFLETIQNDKSTDFLNEARQETDTFLEQVTPEFNLDKIIEFQNKIDELRNKIKDLKVEEIIASNNADVKRVTQIRQEIAKLNQDIGKITEDNFPKIGEVVVQIETTKERIEQLEKLKNTKNISSDRRIYAEFSLAVSKKQLAELLLLQENNNEAVKENLILYQQLTEKINQTARALSNIEFIANTQNILTEINTKRAILGGQIKPFEMDLTIRENSLSILKNQMSSLNSELSKKESELQTTLTDEINKRITKLMPELKGKDFRTALQQGQVSSQSIDQRLQQLGEQGDFSLKQVLETAKQQVDIRQQTLNLDKSIVDTELEILNTRKERLRNARQARIVGANVNERIDTLQQLPFGGVIASYRDAMSEVRNQERLLEEAYRRLESASEDPNVIQQEVDNTRLALAQAKAGLLQQQRSLEDYYRNLDRQIQDFNRQLFDFNRQLEDTRLSAIREVRTLNESYSDLVRELDKNILDLSNQLEDVKDKIKLQQLKNQLIVPGASGLGRELNNIILEYLQSEADSSSKNRSFESRIKEVESNYLASLRRIRELQEQQSDAERNRLKTIKDIQRSQQDLVRSLSDLIRQTQRELGGSKDSINRVNNEIKAIAPKIQNSGEQLVLAILGVADSIKKTNNIVNFKKGDHQRLINSGSNIPVKPTPPKTINKPRNNQKLEALRKPPSAFDSTASIRREQIRRQNKPKTPSNPPKTQPSSNPPKPQSSSNPPKPQSSSNPPKPQSSSNPPKTPSKPQSNTGVLFNRNTPFTEIFDQRNWLGRLRDLSAPTWLPSIPNGGLSGGSHIERFKYWRDRKTPLVAAEGANAQNLTPAGRQANTLLRQNRHIQTLLDIAGLISGTLAVPGNFQGNRYGLKPQEFGAFSQHLGLGNTNLAKANLPQNHLAMIANLGDLGLLDELQELERTITSVGDIGTNERITRKIRSIIAILFKDLKGKDIGTRDLNSLTQDFEKFLMERFQNSRLRSSVDEGQLYASGISDMGMYELKKDDIFKLDPDSKFEKFIPSLGDLPPIPKFDFDVPKDKVETIKELGISLIDAEKILEQLNEEMDKLTALDQLIEKGRQITEAWLSTKRAVRDAIESVADLTLNAKGYLTVQEQIKQVGIDVARQYRSQLESLQDQRKALEFQIDSNRRNLEVTTLAMNALKIKKPEDTETANEYQKQIDALTQSTDDYVNQLSNLDGIISQVENNRGIAVRAAEDQEALNQAYEALDKYNSLMADLADRREMTSPLAAIFGGGGAKLRIESDYRKRAKELSEDIRAGLGTVYTPEQAREMQSALQEMADTDLTKAFVDANPVASGLRDIIKGAVTDFENLGQTALNVLESIANKLLDNGLNMLLGNLFGGGGGISNLFGGVGNIGNAGGGLGNLFGGGMGSLFTGASTFSLGTLPAFVPGFAYGGSIDEAMQKERNLSGKEPVLSVLHQGEEVLSTLNQDAQFYRALKRSGQWDELKTGSGVQSFATGGTVRSVQVESGGSSNQRMAYAQTTVYNITTPNADSFRKSQAQLIEERERRNREQIERYR